MAYWTRINGIITVSTLGRTQPEKRYILETVLDHLPKISKYGKVDIHIIQRDGFDSYTNCDEFLNKSNLGKDRHGYFSTQSEYLLVIDGDLSNVFMRATLKSFMKWLFRLAKRAWVIDYLIQITDGYETKFLTYNPQVTNVFAHNGNWCDYLMWKRNRNENGHLLSGKPD